MKLLPTLSLTLIFAVSCTTDSQKRLIHLESPAHENSSTPRLFTDNTGSVFMSWIEEQDNLATLKYARFDGERWEQPLEITSDSTWFLNWADYPSIISLNGKPMAAHWLNKTTGGTYSYEVNISAFDNQWLEKITPHKDNTPTEHGFVSMAPATDSTFMAIWLDGRNTDGREHHEYSNLEKAMTLRGVLINKKSEILNKFLIDESVCDCCNTSLAKTDKGFIAAYRDRTSEEIRDISISRFEEEKWSEPKPVYSDNWKIAACPVNGPAIDALGSTVAVAWFTGVDGKPKVQLAISENAGELFKTPILLDDKSPIGRVDLSLDENTIWVSWLSPSGENAELKIKAFTLDGVELSSYSIPNLSKSRRLGFPHISVLNNELIVAYTDVMDEYPNVKTLVLD